MPHPPSKSQASASWSAKIEAKYRCELSDDLVRWFDDGIWKSASGMSANRFLTAIEPEDLLDQAPHAIWPALMPCDFLPVLSNAMGDWLCLRIGEDNRASQIVHWYHGGGDWIPWGNSLAEAVLFDSLRSRLPGNRRDHAVAPIVADESFDETRQEKVSDAKIQSWVAESLQRDREGELRNLSGHDLAFAMLESRLCEPAVLCGLVIDALHNPAVESLIRSTEIGSTEISETESVQESNEPGQGEKLQQVLFDNRLIDTALLAGDNFKGISVDQILGHQDWEAVGRYCQRCTEIAPELAWGWDVLGYVFERAGDAATAIECYRNGLECSIFTDQTVRVRTHGFNGDGQKFAAARLIGLGYRPEEPDEKEYFRCLGVATAEERRDQVRKYFSQRARQSPSDQAHRLWVRAGWDLGAEPMLAFAELLEEIAASAKDAGRVAQSQLAVTHRHCFRERYGI